jgi:hypothetical protein
MAYNHLTETVVKYSSVYLGVEAMQNFLGILTLYDTLSQRIWTNKNAENAKLQVKITFINGINQTITPPIKNVHAPPHKESRRALSILTMSGSDKFPRL